MCYGKLVSLLRFVWGYAAHNATSTSSSHAAWRNYIGEWWTVMNRTYLLLITISLLIRDRPKCRLRRLGVHPAELRPSFWYAIFPACLKISVDLCRSLISRILGFTNHRLESLFLLRHPNPCDSRFSRESFSVCSSSKKYMPSGRTASLTVQSKCKHSWLRQRASYYDKMNAVWYHGV